MIYSFKMIYITVYDYIQTALILIVLVISLLFVFSSAYKSCEELLNAGFTKDGIYQILSDQSEVIDIYCDQSSWGGGNRNETSCDPQTVSQRVAASDLNHIWQSE